MVGTQAVAMANALGGLANTDGKTVLMFFTLFIGGGLVLFGTIAGGQALIMLIFGFPILLIGNYFRVLEINWTLMTGGLSFVIFIGKYLWDKK